MLRPRFSYLSYPFTFPLPSQQQFKQSQILKCNQTILWLSKLGRLKEARQVFDSMPQRDTVSWNTMISGYTQNGQLHEAKSLFNEFQRKDVRTWTILLSGYAKNGQMDEARLVFESMPERNVVSWNALVSGYVQNGELRKALEMFDKMPNRNASSLNSIITGYCQFGMMEEAREVFGKMEMLRNNVTWMVLASGFVEISAYREAWRLILMMLRSGARPDQAIFVVGLTAIMGLNNLDLVGSLRTMAMKMGFEEDVRVGTAILNAYTRNGSLDDAINFFELMPQRNEYSWTTMIAAFVECERLDDAIALYGRNSEKHVAIQATMISAYAQNGRIYEARRILDEVKSPNVVTWNAMLAGYAHNGMLDEAKNIFFRMPVKNAASWAAMISGLVKNRSSKEALMLFSELHRTGAVPTHSGFTSALLACANSGDARMGKQIHSLSIKIGCQYNSYVGNGLISMYAKCKNLEDVSQVFSTMRVRDTISWNSVISGLAENSMLDDAQNAFEKMPKQDVVSWSAIISACVQAGEGEDALRLFLKMLALGFKPNDLTITSLLSACGCLGAIKLGEQFHALIVKYGFVSCLCVSNSLITMYFRCGSLNGLCVFEEISNRDVVTWNAIITGCAQNGLAKEAVLFFEQMKAEGVPPDETSFLGVLGGCSHTGLVEKDGLF